MVACKLDHAQKNVFRISNFEARALYNAMKPVKRDEIKFTGNFI